MSIWIRSQCGRNLIHANDIWVEDKKILANVGTPSIDVGTRLGTYATDDEAMKVLDEIHAVLELCADGVFVMPPAEEITTNQKERFSHQDYMDFVAILQDEGDDDIPSEEQWRAELESEYAKSEVPL